MDDMVLWGDDHGLLLEQGRRLEQFIAERLFLSLKPFCLNRTSTGLSFLGYRIKYDDIRLTAQSKRRYIRKMKLYRGLYEAGIWTQADLRSHLLPLNAFVEKARTLGLRKKYLQITKTYNLNENE
jgi:hypothetical protein